MSNIRRAFRKHNLEQINTFAKCVGEEQTLTLKSQWTVQSAVAQNSRVLCGAS